MNFASRSWSAFDHPGELDRYNNLGPHNQTHFFMISAVMP
jgi:hypothetical protein